MRLVCSAFAFLCATAVQVHADFVVSSGPTQNVNCSGTTCTATARNAALNVQDLENRLAASAVTLASGGGAQNIDFAAPVSWTSANGLGVDAQRSVKIERPLLVAGDGALTLQTNHGGNGGDLLISPQGKIGFLGSDNALTINGKQYVLVNSIATLASAIAADPKGHFALGEDYDASVDGVYASSPIGVFHGTFEGLGNVISNLSINDPSSQALVGLFAGTGAASIRDLYLRNAKVSSTGFASFVGALVGYSSGGRLTNDTVSGVVSGGQFSYVGGLAGVSRTGSNGKHFAYAAITRSRVSGQVVGGYRGLVGGLVGFNIGVILSSSSLASATGQNRSIVGGLAGFTANDIENSFATGPTSGGKRSYVGGLVGGSDAKIIECYALGSVTTGPNGHAGGLEGLAGALGSTIFESYSAGHVSGGTGSDLGGFIGFDHTTGSIGTSHWDIDSSGQSQAAGNIQNDPGITGLTDAQMKAGLPSDFDPKDWAHDPSINGGFPYLKHNRPPP